MRLSRGFAPPISGSASNPAEYEDFLPNSLGKTRDTPNSSGGIASEESSIIRFTFETPSVEHPLFVKEKERRRNRLFR